MMHKGSQIYYASYGFRDSEKRLPVTDETVFPVCSMTKAVTAVAIGVLVEERKANWDTLAKNALPTFKIHDGALPNCTTITDLLCHRTGISWGNNLFVGTENSVISSERDSMKYMNSQTRLLPFRAQFSYNNIAFELASKVIESLSGESYFDFVHSRILNPLGMDRTFFKTPPSSIDNVGKCYNALNDGTSAPSICVKAGDNWFGTSSAGILSCVCDLTKLYKVLFTSFSDQFVTGKTSAESSPLK